MTTFEKITDLLNSHHVSFELIEHAAEGQTVLISEIRGNELQQAAKAMVLQALNGAAPPKYVLAIVPGDSKVNFKNVARLVGCKKSSFAPPEVAQALTDCQMGAVPPFSFHDELELRVDDRLRNVGKLYFNAGELDKSIALNVEDYFRIVGEQCLGEISTPVIANA